MAQLSLSLSHTHKLLKPPPPPPLPFNDLSPSPPLFPHAPTSLSSSPRSSSKARVLVLSNSFVSAQLDVTSGRIIALTGDFNGTRSFPATNNALASPWHLETEDTSGVVSSSSAAPTLTILSNTSTLVSVKLEGVTDSAGDGSGDSMSAAVATEDWTVTLRSNERGVELNTTGTATVTAASKTRCVLLWRDRLGGLEGCVWVCVRFVSGRCVVTASVVIVTTVDLSSSTISSSSTA